MESTREKPLPVASYPRERRNRSPKPVRIRLLSITPLARDLLNRGLSFCFETVFSHPSKIDLTAHAKTLGYRGILGSTTPG